MGLASGLKLEDAMELAASLETEGTAARKCCEDCADRLDRGEELSHALKESGCLPASACRMLALGVRSGSADTVMAHIAQQLEEESEEALAAAVGRVEPTLVIVTSVLVGAILLSVMLPLMNIMAAVG
jgi:type IV pilus assembly protein PilC